MKTPQQSYPALARALGLQGELYLKREDLHPYGSHKGRSIPPMIKEYKKQGITSFVISSSGNAALAAVHTLTQHNKNNPQTPLTLRVYVGNHLPKNKLERLQSLTDGQQNIIIEQVERPKQAALNLEKNSAGASKYLRQSTDDTALIGYHELAKELNKIPDLAAIFIPTSSGTTAQALGEAFAALDQKPQIHIVQTTACHPIAAEFVGGIAATTHSIADAIVDNVAHRKEKVTAAIKNNGGAGWIVTDEEITAAMSDAKKFGNITISANSALAVAGLRTAIKQNLIFGGPVVCLITGA